MPEKPELRIVIYDIASDSRRRRIAEILEDRAVRVQESAFEVRLTASQSRRLMQALKDQSGPGDSVRMYTVPDQALHKCEAHGGGPVTNGAQYWLL